MVRSRRRGGRCCSAMSTIYLRRCARSQSGRGRGCRHRCTSSFWSGWKRTNGCAQRRLSMLPMEMQWRLRFWSGMKGGGAQSARRRLTKRCEARTPTMERSLAPTPSWRLGSKRLAIDWTSLARRRPRSKRNTRRSERRLQAAWRRRAVATSRRYVLWSEN